MYPINPFGDSNAVQTACAVSERGERSIAASGPLSATWHILSSGTNALNLVANGGADYFQQQNNVYSPPTLQYEIAYGNPGTTVLTMSNNLQTNVNLNLVDLLTPSSGAFTSTTSLGVQQYTTYLNTDQTAGQEPDRATCRTSRPARSSPSSRTAPERNDQGFFGRRNS